MTAQTIISQIGNVLNQERADNSSNKSTSIEEDFSKCLSSNLKSDSKVSTGIPSNTSQKKNGNGIVTNDRTKKTNLDEMKQLNKDRKVKDTVKEPHHKTDKTDVKKNISDTISDLSKKIESIVKKALNISQEELEQRMAQLGFTMLELLDPKNLIDLILTVSNETDITALLTNEGLSNQFTDLIQEMGQIDLKEFGISEEELRLQLDNSISSTMHEEDVDSISGKDLLKSEESMMELKSEPGKDTLEEGIPFSAFKENGVEEGKENQDLSSVIDSDSVKETLELNSNSSNKAMDNGKEKENHQEPTKMDQFIDQLSFSVTGSNGVDQEIIQVTQMKDIVNQIVKEIKIHIKPGVSDMELRLNPENLGRVNLAVTSKEGILTAKFTVQNSVAKEAIESQMQILKDNLNHQGVKVEAIEVTVSNFSFSEGNETSKEEQEKKHSKKPFKIDGSNDSNEITEDEDGTNMIMNGSTVSYTA